MAGCATPLLIRNFILGDSFIATAAPPHQTGGERDGQGKMCTTVNMKIENTISIVHCKRSVSCTELYVRWS
jgi:hypothetical protein